VLSAASRLLLAGPTDEGAAQAGIGFADIVGYTRQTRSLKQAELARLVDVFEARALAIVTGHSGRIIKTIGDEILYATDRPEDAAAIALELVEEHVGDEDFPQLRVGVAWGTVLHRLGDVFGPTVNIAARLTSGARPGKVLVDKDLADALQDDERFQLRRMRRTAVKGYRRLEPWKLRRAADSEDTDDD
jgi:adenylate cyclase